MSNLIKIVTLYALIGCIGYYYDLENIHVSLSLGESSIGTNLLVLTYATISILLLYYIVIYIIHKLMNLKYYLFNIFNKSKQKQQEDYQVKLLEAYITEDIGLAKKTLIELKELDLNYELQLICYIISKNLGLEFENFTPVLIQIINQFNSALNTNINEAQAVVDHNKQYLKHLKHLSQFFETKLAIKKASHLIAAGQTKEAINFIIKHQAFEKSLELKIYLIDIFDKEVSNYKIANVIQEVLSKKPSYSLFNKAVILSITNDMENDEKKIKEISNFFSNMEDNFQVKAYLTRYHIENDNLIEAQKIFSQFKPNDKHKIEYLILNIALELKKGSIGTSLSCIKHLLNFI